MEEFVSICHYVICNNLTLIEGFRCGLDDEIQVVMSQGDSCWSLVDYLNVALWIDGSSFTVGSSFLLPGGRV